MKAVLLLVVAAACMALGAGGQALAWGSTAHRMIGRLAMEALPAETPDFLRTPQAAEAVGELSREPDRWKGAGRTHDSDRDPAHFLDLDDGGNVLGGPALASLPATRAEYEAALRAAGTDSWKAGYLPYSIIDGWQQVTKDFAYLRADLAGARFATDASKRAWMLADAAQRRDLILRDIGALSHYVGDGSQPLHVTVHFNGWGAYPNPNGYSQDKVHSPFEGEFVRNFVAAQVVRTRMAAYRDCACPIEQRTTAYLMATNRAVASFYDLYKAGGFAGFKAAEPRGVSFAAEHIAAGASELRDLVVWAWRASAAGEVGWTPVKVVDVEAGRVDPYDSLRGVD